MAKQAQLDAVRPILNELDKGATVAEQAIDTVVSNADKAAEVLESGLETVADVVPEAFDKGVHVAADVTKAGVKAIRDPRKMAIILGVTGVVLGAGAGFAAYKLLKKRLEKDFEERLNAELDEMREFYLRRKKEGKFASPRTAAEALLVDEAVEALDKYEGKGVKAPEQSKDELAAKRNAAPTEPTGQVRYDKIARNEEIAEVIREAPVVLEEAPGGTVTNNVFVNGKALVPDDWDAEAEEANRTPEIPYVISYQEYMENTFEHEQETLTYYAADKVLADAREDAIPNVEAVVGPDALSRFGEGSKDPRTVYVRNERTESDYEVVLRDGSFQEEVLGLRHSDSRRPLRGRRWDDSE
jgi:hypothetical protein